jgi:hypothetical protein
MPHKNTEADDPLELVGVVLPADLESTRDMAYVFAEEFARLGYTREQLLGLFKNPYYGGAHGVYQALGENDTLSIIDECLNVWGSIRIRVQDVQTVQTDRSPASLRHGSGQAFLPRVAAEDEGGGLNDWNDLNGLNQRREERDDG